jgi:hypothetical protein
MAQERARLKREKKERRRFKVLRVVAQSGDSCLSDQLMTREHSQNSGSSRRSSKLRDVDCASKDFQNRDDCSSASNSSRTNQNGTTSSFHFRLSSIQTGTFPS